MAGAKKRTGNFQIDRIAVRAPLEALGRAVAGIPMSPPPTDVRPPVRSIAELLQSFQWIARDIARHTFGRRRRITALRSSISAQNSVRRPLSSSAGFSMKARWRSTYRHGRGRSHGLSQTNLADDPGPRARFLRPARARNSPTMSATYYIASSATRTCRQPTPSSLLQTDRSKGLAPAGRRVLHLGVFAEDRNKDRPVSCCAPYARHPLPEPPTSF